MSETRWQEHVLPLPDHDMAWYETGSGPVVVVLSGGPGDDHSYLRPVTEPLAGRFRVVLYDQRGTGRSQLQQASEEMLHPDRLTEDLDALRVHLGEERLRLVGHSWGGNLALLYCAAYPDRVDRAVLVGLGPLDEEMGAVAAANLMKPLSRAERVEDARLGDGMQQALEENDADRAAELHARRLPYFARGAFLSPEKAKQFVDDYLAADSHRKLNRRVNRTVLIHYRRMSIWPGLDRVSASLLVLYGYQDFEPTTQAYRIRERVPQTRISLLNRCGHMPWLEQPEAFYRELEEFLCIR